MWNEAISLSFWALTIWSERLRFSFSFSSFYFRFWTYSIKNYFSYSSIFGDLGTGCVGYYWSCEGFGDSEAEGWDSDLGC